MKLYVYDHCPYCVKARMIFGFKNMAVEEVTLLNDDEQTPIKMIGQKMLPILQKDDGGFMPESLDIISYIDQNFGEAIVQASREDEVLKTWLQGARDYHYRLAMPRWVIMPIEEFATPDAVAYFTKKKEQSIGPFKDNLVRTAELVEMANKHLLELEAMAGDGTYWWGENLSLDDFHLFATLRVMTTTKGVEFPPKVAAYANRMAELSKVPLHWDMAIGEVQNA